MSAVFLHVARCLALAFPRNVYTFPRKWSDAMAEPRQVEDGQRFVLTSHHKIVAEIGPPSSDVAIRKPGALRGKIKLADDFDALPADVLKVMEEGA